MYALYLSLLAIVVVILIVVLVVLPFRIRDHEKFLTGLWVGDPDFLERADLSAMFLYIAPCERLDGAWKRQGYLVMFDANGDQVSNQGIEVTYQRPFSRWGSALISHFSVRTQETYRISDALITYDDVGIMPDNMSLSLNTSEGTLALYSEYGNRKLYAFLVKDNETSLLANTAYRDGIEVTN
jgi:hypothetical protein